MILNLGHHRFLDKIKCFYVQLSVPKAQALHSGDHGEMQRVHLVGVVRGSAFELNMERDLITR